MSSGRDTVGAGTSVVGPKDQPERIQLGTAGGERNSLAIQCKPFARHQACGGSRTPWNGWLGGQSASCGQEAR